MLDPDLIAWLRRHFLLAGLAGVVLALALARVWDSVSARPGWKRLVRCATRRRAWAPVAVAVLVLALRAAALPFWEKPVPSVLDEFSYLLLGDTLAAGRAANPPHVLWEHFETLFVLQKPAYASAYPPAQGLALAAGQSLAGHPWWGVWFSAGLMCAALGWMLAGWLPPFWALLGTVWAGVQLGLLSYWMNSYWGGAVAAMAGALVVGALPRIARRPRVRHGLLLGLGLILLANSRPYEGLVMGAASLIWLGWKLRRERRLWQARGTLLAAGSVVAAGAMLTAWYCREVTGSPFRLPAQEYIRQYAASPIFVWQPPPPEPAYRHPVLRDAHLRFRIEREQYQTAAGAMAYSAWKLVRLGSFYLGPLILLPLLVAPWLWRARTRCLLALAAITAAAILATVPLQPHYAAPLAGVLYVLAVQALRMLWIAGRRGSSFGRYTALAAPAVVALTLGLSFLTERPRLLLRQRAALEETLRREGGRHLVIVRYGQVHNLAEEWVYNAADIDRSPIVWARDMGPERNERLLRYYADRRLWTLEADERPLRLREMAIGR